MESKIEDQNLTEKFKEIVKSNGISDPILEVVLDDSGLRGENNCSAINYVTVKFKDGDKKPLHLFIKRREKGNAIVDAGMMFEKETLFFSEYIPIAKKLCESMGQEKLMSIYPKCYYADENMIVFENLVVERGFTLLDKGERQDFEAAKLGIKSLAIHHSISHAIIMELGGPTQFIERFQLFNLEPYAQSCVKEMMGPSLDQRVDLYIRLLEKNELEGRDEVLKELKSIHGNSFDIMMEYLSNKTTKFPVLLHGDYWNNNMLFVKDKKTGKVLEHIAIDFQLPRLTSPAVDLGYYLFSSIKGDIRRKHQTELFNIYLSTLHFTTKDLGHSLDLPLESLNLEYKKYFGFGFFIGAIFMCSAYFDVLKDSAGEGKDMGDWASSIDRLMNKWIVDNPDKCVEMCKDIILDVNEYIMLSK